MTTKEQRAAIKAEIERRLNSGKGIDGAVDLVVEWRDLALRLQRETFGQPAVEAPVIGAQDPT